MFREIVKQYRGSQTRVCITLASGKYVTGTIVDHGPEALVVQSSPKEQQLVMKQAIETIRPAGERKPPRKE